MYSISFCSDSLVSKEIMEVDSEIVDSNCWFRSLSVKDRQRSSVAVMVDWIWDWMNLSRF
jgi:hypothetical protein